MSFTPCPTTCAVCYSESHGFCDDVVHRQIEIPKERVVFVQKRIYQSKPNDAENPTSPRKRQK